MIKNVFSVVACLVIVASGSLVMAGGAVGQPMGAQPCPPQCGPMYRPPIGPGGNPCAFWGDAPFPGICGGIVALPFLVVGTLLGGNPLGPCAPAPYNCAPRRAVLPGYYAAPPRCGPGYPPNFMANSILGGFPPAELASGLVGSITGGAGLL
jgi:hypothetical protein